MSTSILNYGIIGTDAMDGSRPTFSSVVGRSEVQRVLVEVAASPRSLAFIDSALEESEVSRKDLEELGLIRCESERCVLSFTFLTSTDVQKVREVAEVSARSLVADILARSKEIEVGLNRYRMRGIDLAAVAYIVLGCFSLDWDALAMAAERGYAAMAPEDGYIPWAEEKSDLSLKGFYWGSHNEYLPDVTVTSFGDHFSLPRHALPDSVWRLQLHLRQMDMPDSLKSKLIPATRQALNAMMRNAGRLMLILRDGQKDLAELAEWARVPAGDAETLATLLVELGYATAERGGYQAAVPVLTQVDAPMLEELRHVSESVIDGWMTANYDQLKLRLSGTTPVRFGVPFAETFTQIWHYIFGAANRQLVEVGLFADPYADSRKHKGFIPVVWHPAVWRHR